MKRTLRIAAVIAAGFVASNAQAELWDVETSVGVSPAVMSYVSKEPEGDTPRDTAVYPLTLTATFNLDRINRIVVDFRYLDFEISAGSNEIGATVEGYQFTTALQHQFRLSRNFRPWLGGGIVSSVIEVTDRYQTDDGGFLLERYDDREETALSALANAGLDWDISRTWVLAAEARYEHPFSDGLEGYGLAAGVRYRF